MVLLCDPLNQTRVVSSSNFLSYLYSAGILSGSEPLVFVPFTADFMAVAVLRELAWILMKKRTGVWVLVFLITDYEVMGF